MGLWRTGCQLRLVFFIHRSFRFTSSITNGEQRLEQIGYHLAHEGDFAEVILVGLVERREDVERTLVADGDVWEVGRCADRVRVDGDQVGIVLEQEGDDLKRRRKASLNLKLELKTFVTTPIIRFEAAVILELVKNCRFQREVNPSEDAL